MYADVLANRYFSFVRFNALAHDKSQIANGMRIGLRRGKVSHLWAI